MTHMQAAERLVLLERQRKAKAEALDTIEAEQKKIKARLMQAMEDGEFQSSSRVAGATVFLRTEIWAGAPKVRDERGKEVTDHRPLIAALEAAGLRHLLPRTVNTRTLTSYVKECLDEAEVDALASLEERIAASTLPDVLKDVVTVTEKHDIRINGA
jgi:hypothetical protein